MQCASVRRLLALAFCMLLAAGCGRGGGEPHKTAVPPEHTDPAFVQINVRRLFNFIEESILDGTQWVVFEPNDEKLWARVRDTIRDFLRGQWRLGAMTGVTEEQAFFVTCDRTTMTQDDILNGRLVCQIGIAPVRPAEFIIFRIFQNTIEAQS